MDPSELPPHLEKLGLVGLLEHFDEAPATDWIPACQ